MKNIFYITNDPERALGLEQEIENFHIVCIDSNNISEGLKRDGVDIFCLEDELGSKNPIFRNSNKLLQRDEVQKYIKENSSNGDENFIMVFKISPAIERTIQKLSLESLNTTSQLNKEFEGKISQYEFLSNLGVRIPESEVMKLSDLKSYLERIGLPLVIQYDRGHTGEGTVFIKENEELNELITKFPERVVKVSEYIEGEAWTLNGAVTRFGTVYGGLSKQITGIKELTDKEGATVGNDWSEAEKLNKNVVKQIEEITQKVGSAMSKRGYKGLFGLDFIVGEGEVYLIEINARQPASTGMHTKLMLRNEEVPLMLLHIAEFLSGDNNDYISFINKTLNTKFDETSLKTKIESQNKGLHRSYNASQFIVRNDQPEQATVTRSLRSGIYKDKVFLRDGYKLNDLEDKCEYLLTCAPKGRTITSGSEIGRIQSMHTVQTGRGKLKEHYLAKVKLIRKNMSKENDQTSKSELPKDIIEYIDRYRKLNIVGKEVNTPYYRNVKRVRAGLRSLLGKGTPEEIEEETLIYAKLRSFSLTESSPQQIREFMESQGIGIDCSGFVAHIYAYWLSKRGHSRLDTHLRFQNESFKRKIIRKFRYIENISSDLITNSENTDHVEISDVKPGDLIRLKGIKRGDHVAMIYSTEKDQGDIKSFTYVHSAEHYGRENGIKFGKVEVIDPKKELKDQNWLEVEKASGRNYTLEGLLNKYDDNGLRRPKFSKLLK